MGTTQCASCGDDHYICVPDIPSDTTASLQLEIRAVYVSKRRTPMNTVITGQVQA